jgi:hypothetical protein
MAHIFQELPFGPKFSHWPGHLPYVVSPSKDKVGNLGLTSNSCCIIEKQMTVNCDCDNLIEALQNELQEHGELLNLFNEQASVIIEHKPNLFRAAQEAISLQLGVINECRARREETTKDLAKAVGQTPDSPLRSLIDCCAAAFRPLLDALKDEVSRLILTNKRRARQNEMLLARFSEVSPISLDRGTIRLRATL